MPYPVKADFHLHTYHSDNRDRMTPADYAALAEQYGYSVLGFCDHHHNLTQEKWAELRAEAAAHTSRNLLLTTGYEATWMDGHLCVLGKERFDGESIADAMCQTWARENIRILAHPDNNVCAWKLPLPVDVQAVEVINGGQDPYSVRVTSPCNGLTTYRRYLTLNQRVAAVAQSDCHERGIFGRVWTHLFLPDDVPLSWETVQTALHRGNTSAVMGDLPIQFWAVDGTLMGEKVNDPACRTLRWRVPQGATVTLSVADRPLAFFPPTASGEGEHVIQGNGPHWIQVQRGLAWAVSSPIWVANQQADVAAGQARLAQHSMVVHASAALCSQLDWLQRLEEQRLEEQWPHFPMPITVYVEWFASLLPQNWSDYDVAFSGPGDPADWALGRIHFTYELSKTLIAELCRVRAQHTGQPSSAGHRLLIAGPIPSIPAGVYLHEVDVPRDWEDVQVEQDVPTFAVAVPGVRDPLNGPRTRTQMEELVVWLARGELHEYYLAKVEIVVEEESLNLVVDLEPARLGGVPTPHPDLAAKLQAWLELPEITCFHVHLRMPRRFALALHLQTEWPSSSVEFTLVNGTEVNGTETEQGRVRFLKDEVLSNNTVANSITVQSA